MALTVTAANLFAIAPAARPAIVDGIVANQAALARAGILDSAARAALFFAQTPHESGGFTILVESGWYTSAARIRAVWPSRFPTEAAAAPYVRQPEKLFNLVYANRLGNGPPSSGDGFRHRGRGVIQSTGKANNGEIGDVLGLDLRRRPELLETFPPAITSAVVFWSSRGLNAFADAGDFDGATRRINGGLTGIADRREYWRRARLVRWGEGGSAPAPAAGFLRIGDTGPAVLALQRRLRAHGFYTDGKLDGDFGGGTRAEVVAFQAAHQLIADGVVGPATRAVLDREPRATASRPLPPLTRPAPTVPPGPPTDRSGNAGCNLAGLLARFRKS